MAPELLAVREPPPPPLLPPASAMCPPPTEAHTATARGAH
jgi:hypothetical protein